MFSHSFVSEGVKYNKKLMTNKYVCVNDQTYSAKIYVLLFAKFFVFGIFMGRDEFDAVKLQNNPVDPRAAQ